MVIAMTLPYTPPGFLVHILEFDSSTNYDIPIPFRPYFVPIFIFLLNLGAFNVPVLLSVVLNGTIGAEFAHLLCCWIPLNVNAIDQVDTPWQSF